MNRMPEFGFTDATRILSYRLHSSARFVHLRQQYSAYTRSKNSQMALKDALVIQNIRNNRQPELESNRLEDRTEKCRCVFGGYPTRIEIHFGNQVGQRSKPDAGFSHFLTAPLYWLRNRHQDRFPTIEKPLLLRVLSRLVDE